MKKACLRWLTQSGSNVAEKAKRAIAVLNKAIYAIYYVYDAEFGNLEENHTASAGEELAEWVNFLLSDPPYNLRRQSKLESADKNVFSPNDMDDFRDLAKKPIKPNSHGHAFYCALQYSLKMFSPLFVTGVILGGKPDHRPYVL